MQKLLLILSLFIALPTFAQAQQVDLLQDSVRVIRPKKRLSPIAIASYIKGDTYIKITYGQPFKRNREIFGALIPYNQVWRTGANEATEITVTRDVKIGDKILKAGTYTIFTIPNPDEWTIIFNKSLGLWGAYDYEKVKSQDVLRVKAKVTQTQEIYEAFTIRLTEAPYGVDMELIWDRTKVTLPIYFIE